MARRSTPAEKHLPAPVTTIGPSRLPHGGDHVVDQVEVECVHRRVVEPDDRHTVGPSTSIGYLLGCGGTSAVLLASFTTAAASRLACLACS